MERLRKKPWTTGELFKAIVERLKENGEYPDILDYDCPYDMGIDIKNYEVSFINDLDFGGSEGIYLTLHLHVWDRKKKVYNNLKLGTFKTLKNDKSAMEIMGKLLADFIFEGYSLINSAQEDFIWEGYAVKGYKLGKKLNYSYDTDDKEKIPGLIDKLFAYGADNVKVYDYSTRELVREENETGTFIYNVDDYNLRNVKDSMEIDSESLIASYKTEKGCVTLEVRGEVNVTYKDEHYHRPSEFPDELKKLIRRGYVDEDNNVVSWTLCPDVYVGFNNWFELFYQTNKYTCPESVVVDAEGLNPGEVYRLIKDYAVEMEEVMVA